MSDLSLQLIERLGLPIVLLIGLAWAMVKASKWLAPRIDKLIAKHESFLDSLERDLNEQTITLRDMRAEQALSRTAEAAARVALMECMERHQDSTSECLREIRDCLLRLSH